MIALAVALTSSVICKVSSAHDAHPVPGPAEVEFVFGHREKGEKSGEATQVRGIKDLVGAPLVNNFTSLDGNSSVVRISYVGYASFQVAENARNAESPPLKPGHVFAVQVFKGKKGVTNTTAEENATKLVIYQASPQTLYEDGDVSVTIRNKKR